MIGRNDPNHIFAVGTRSSPELHTIHHQANKYIHLQIENPKSFRLGRSDHTAFYYMNIPIMYLFGGMDPDYHSTRDTWNKLKPDKLEKVSKLTFLTALEVAERKKRIVFHKKQVDD